MTNDEGLKPGGAPQRSPELAQALPRAATGMVRSAFRSAQDRVVARLSRGEPLDPGARQMNISVARLTKWRDRGLSGAAGALKERERDDRDDEPCP